MAEADAILAASLVRLGLTRAGERPRVTALAGGVSSDVYRVDLASGPVCVKRALHRLRVAAEWTAPLERSDYEVAWLRLAHGIGVAVPEVIAHDPGAKLFVMRFLGPAEHPVWKGELAAGRVDPAVASAVGRAIARVHAATAHDAAIARRFDTSALFEALRIDPYLRGAAAAHPDLRAPLMALAERTLEARIALVHGDVSPKNILVGPDGPVLLDAECAWYGDPAFDLAFVATHLLLKPVWRPAHRAAYRAALDALLAAYRPGVGWEPVAALEARAAPLTAGLLLARVDGKSPVEYLTAEADRDRVRQAARALIAAPALDLAELVERWEGGLC